VNLLDTRTILFGDLLTTAIGVVVMRSLWTRYRRRSGAYVFWLAGYGLHFAGTLMVALRLVIPAPVSILFGVPLFLAGALLLLLGSEQYVGRNPSALRLWVNWGLLALLFLVQAWFTFVTPSLFARNTNLSAGLVIYMGQAAWLFLLRAPADYRSSTRLTGMLFLALVVVSVLRVVAELYVPPGQDFFRSGLYDNLALVAYQMLFVALAFGLLLMVNQRFAVERERDVWGRRLAERELRENEARYRALVESSSDHIYILDREGRYLVSNGHVSLPPGMKAVVMLRIEDLHEPVTAETYARNLEQVFATGRSVTFEHPMAAGDGVQWRLDTLYPLWRNGKVWAAGGICRDITERKLAEQALRDAAAHWQTTFEGIGDAVCLLDTENRIERCNGATSTLLGKSAEELRGESCCKAVHGRSAPIDGCPVLRARESGRRETAEMTLGDRYLQVTADPLLDREGRFAGAIHIVADITERKRAEMALQAEHDRAQTYLDIVGSIVVALDRTGRITLVNRKACEVLGYREEEMLGRDWFDTCIPEHVRNEVKEVFDQLMAGTVVPFERYTNEVLTKSGQERLVDWHNVVLRGKDGLPEGTLSAGMDSTERKQAERALKESEEFLVDSQRLADMCSWKLEFAGNKAYWSDNCFALYGLKPGEIVPSFEAFQSLVHPDDLQVLENEYAEVVKSRSTRTSETRIVLADGTVKWIHHSVAPIVENDQVVGLKGIQIDTTERKKVEAALYRSGRELEAHRDDLERLVAQRTQELRAAHASLVRQEKLATLGRVAGSVAHELRNPLGVIRNASFLLQQTVAGKLEGKPLEYLRAIDEHIARANQAITMILDFTWQQRAEPGLCSLPSVLDRALSEAAPPSAVKVSLELPNSLPRFVADERQMTAVFRNLLTNAVQAMSCSGTIRIGARAAGADVVVTVSDTGCGIPPQNLGRLFEPLFTTKAVGVGLGLAICRAFVEINQGSISVASEVGKGTTFTVTLPAAGEQATSDA